MVSTDGKLKDLIRNENMAQKERTENQNMEQNRTKQNNFLSQFFKL